VPQTSAMARLWLQGRDTRANIAGDAAGKPLLPRAIVDPPLRLLSARPMGTGFVALHYEVVRPA
jgi:hypothetical protein